MNAEEPEQMNQKDADNRKWKTVGSFEAWCHYIVKELYSCCIKCMENYKEY